MRTKIYSKLLENGLKINDNHFDNFKNQANIYFRNNSATRRKALKDWDSPQDLILRFDDRLNVFFLFDEYKPVIGFYEYQNDTIQIVPFYNRNLDQAIAEVISFSESLNRKNIESKKKIKEQENR